jgi:hypothetical protein
MCLNGSNDISQRWQYQTIGLATEEPETPSHDCRDMVNIFARISIDVDRDPWPERLCTFDLLCIGRRYGLNIDFRILVAPLPSLSHPLFDQS